VADRVMSQLCVAAVATNDQAAALTPNAGEPRRRNIGGFTDNFYASVGRGAPFKSPRRRVLVKDTKQNYSVIIST
jgi:hypothetical protein